MIRHPRNGGLRRSGPIKSAIRIVCLSFLPPSLLPFFLPSFLAFCLFQIHNLAPPTFQLVSLLAPPQSPPTPPPDRPTSVHTITHSVVRRRRAGDSLLLLLLLPALLLLRQIQICLDTADVVEPFVSVTVGVRPSARPSVRRNGQRWRSGAQQAWRNSRLCCIWRKRSGAAA